MKVLILRFDAPLVSFGGPMVDQNGVVQAFPALSMLTGLIGNAMGWDHRDSKLLADLQDRLRFAARVDRRGEELVDYQSVDLGKPWMLAENAGWTTAGRVAERSGASGEATHLRWRYYRADSIHTVALSLAGMGEPTLDQVAAALREPARPLFLGRKPCLPAAPILHDVLEAESPLRALTSLRRVDGRGDDGPLWATWWADEQGELGSSRRVPVTDERDWVNQIHVGRRVMVEGPINPPGGADAGE